MRSELIVGRPTEVMLPGASDDLTLDQIIKSFISHRINDKHMTWEELQSNLSSTEKQWESKGHKGRRFRQVNKWRQGHTAYQNGLPILFHGHLELEAQIWGAFATIIQVTRDPMRFCSVFADYHRLRLEQRT